MSKKQMSAIERRRKWTTEPNLTRVRGWMRDGLTIEELLKKIGISSKQTIYNWMAFSPEFAQAVNEGREYADRRVEHSLYTRAVGYTAEDVEVIVTDEGGSRTTRRKITKRHIPPDTTAIIYWLKNRKPQDWRDKREVELSAQDALNIKIDYGDDDHSTSE